MPRFEMLGLLLLGALVWLWFDSLRAREIGVDAVRQACKAEGLQLLDETIALHSLRPARSPWGGWTLRRVYFFEFSDTGDNRRRGSVLLLGRQVEMLNLGLRLVY